MSKFVTLSRDKISMSKPGQISDLPPPQAWLDDRALQLRCGGMERLFGRWDVLFGAWERPTGHRRWREALPRNPVLSPTGLWLPDILFDYDGAGGTGPPDPLGHQFHEAYLSLIPTHVRRLAAPFGEHQWLVMDMMWAVSELRARIDDMTRSAESPSIGSEFDLEVLFDASRDERICYAIAVLNKTPAD